MVQTVVHIVGNRELILAIDEIYREAMKRFEVEQLLIDFRPDFLLQLFVIVWSVVFVVAIDAATTVFLVTATVPTLLLLLCVCC